MILHRKPQGSSLLMITHYVTPHTAMCAERLWSIFLSYAEHCHQFSPAPEMSTLLFAHIFLPWFSAFLPFTLTMHTPGVPTQIAYRPHSNSRPTNELRSSKMVLGIEKTGFARQWVRPWVVGLSGSRGDTTQEQGHTTSKPNQWRTTQTCSLAHW